MRLKKKCKNCNKIYEVSQSKYKRSKFCSRECQREYYTFYLKCENCGATIKVPKNKYDKIISGEQVRFYCSKQCRLECERPNIVELKRQFHSKGYILLDDTYVNAKHKMKYLCSKHLVEGIQYINYDNFKSGYGCKYCGFESMKNKRKNDIEKVRVAFKNKGLTLISQTYNNTHQLLEYICDKHTEAGIQKMSYANVLHCCGCPKCNASKGEVYISQFLNKHNIYYETQYSFSDLTGVNGGLLSYDFYIPMYNLLLEYQGEFHDGTANIQTADKFAIQREHDYRKMNYANTHNYNFVEIWYYDNLEDKLNELFIKNPSTTTEM